MKTTACSFKELYVKWSLHYIRLFCSHAEHILRFTSFACSQIDQHDESCWTQACWSGENSRIGLAGKQTEQGCCESLLGLQIIAWLTKVSEPVPFTAAHMCAAYTPTCVGLHDLCALKEACIKSAYAFRLRELVCATVEAKSGRFYRH